MKRFGQKSRRFLWFFLSGLVIFGGLSYAQSDDLLGRLMRLENDVRTLNRAVYSQQGVQGSAGYGAGRDTAAQANAEVQVQQLEMEVRSLTGKLEEQSHEIRQLKGQLERATGDMELRLQDLEKGKRAAATPSNIPKPIPKYVAQPPKPKSAAPDYVAPDYIGRDITVAPPRNTPGQLGTMTQRGSSGSGANSDVAAADYENAFAMLKAGSFDAAEKEFEKFLSRYPDHVLSPNAKYWYGETFYVRGNYEGAARIFAESYQQAPQGAKAHDNLLKLGMSLAGMGNKDDACVALRQLSKETANTSSPVMRRGQQEMSRLGC